jgi:hypothetical protein
MDTETKVQVVIELDPETMQKVKTIQAKTGITDDEIFSIGFLKILHEMTVDEVLTYISLEKYELILNNCDSYIQKIKQYRDSVGECE